MSSRLYPNPSAGLYGHLSGMRLDRRYGESPEAAIERHERARREFIRRRDRDAARRAGVADGEQP